MTVARSPRLVRIALPCAALAACRGDDPVRPAAEVCQPGGVTISVTAGAAPTLSWLPRCRASLLFVVRDDGGGSGQTMWAISSEFEDTRVGEPNTLLPDVRYGVVPAATVERSPLQPLAAGGHYIAVLIARDESTRREQHTVGTLAFSR